MSSLTPPSNFPLVITTSSLQSALDVLLRHELSALDLPIDPTDSIMWEMLEIKRFSSYSHGRVLAS